MEKNSPYWYVIAFVIFFSLAFGLWATSADPPWKNLTYPQLALASAALSAVTLMMATGAIFLTNAFWPGTASKTAAPARRSDGRIKKLKNVRCSRSIDMT